ncbi:MAG: sodium:calcium antiporter, partial [Candidatus Muiribacteriaceae bacterium]
MWLEFLISAVAVISAGFFLTKFGDQISERTSISGGMIGFFLLALATSLPELITSISAVSIQKAPELAFGNIFGSNLFNLFIIFLIDLFSVKGAFATGNRENFLSCIYIVIISMFAIIPIILSNFGVILFPQMPVNIESIIILLFYLYILRTFREEETEETVSEISKKKDSILSPVSGFFVSSLVIIAAGIVLTKSVDAIAVTYGMGKTFAGSLFLAFVTSLPEASVSLSAVRIGAVSMAIGNVL